MKKVTKAIVRRLSRHSFNYYLLILFFLALLIFASWQYYSYSIKRIFPQTGSLAEDQLFATTPKTAYKSLDLKIAGQARFEGSSITKIRDLGTSDSINTSVVSFKVAADNLIEYGLMTQPTTPKPAQGYPVLILCHGYTTPSVYSTYDYYLGDMEQYSKAGFIVIKPDFRGQGLSLHSGKPEGAYYSMAYNTDLMSLIAGVKKTKYLDSNNINLWGHSMGAYIALRAAVISPDIKNVILLSGPVGKIQDMYRSYIPTSDSDNPVANDIRQAVLLRYGNPFTNPKFWSATSPLSYLKQLKAYVQIHVGGLDKTVPPRFSADLDMALTKIRRPHGYFVYPEGDHGLLDEKSQIYDRSLQILRPKQSKA